MKCQGCKYFLPGHDEVRTEDHYEPPEPPMCNEPHLADIAESDETLAVLLENILFALSDRMNCPFRQNRIHAKRRTLKGVYRSRDLIDDN